MNDGTYGGGSGPIYFTSVRCTGDEYNIFNCSYSTLTSRLIHAFDAGVKCFNNTSMCSWYIIRCGQLTSNQSAQKSCDLHLFYLQCLETVQMVLYD